MPWRRGRGGGTTLEENRDYRPSNISDTNRSGSSDAHARGWWLEGAIGNRAKLPGNRTRPVASILIVLVMSCRYAHTHAHARRLFSSVLGAQGTHPSPIIAFITMLLTLEIGKTSGSKWLVRDQLASLLMDINMDSSRSLPDDRFCRNVASGDATQLFRWESAIKGLRLYLCFTNTSCATWLILFHLRLLGIKV
ncbi:hypothetical protein J6590_033808 [Homalodisca vitripennis]|nr:hypothetical protein J6590_033808 [Homalodisca vitripennis]